MLIGYARVSTHDQTADLQKDALTTAGCVKIFTDTISGAKTEREGLDKALSHLRSGDTFVVWKLDRLGRSLQHLIETIKDLQERDIGFKSITENIDTTTPGGKLVFHIFGALAEFERDLIRERTRAGLDAARARGRTGGPKPKVTPQKAAMAQALYDSKDNKDSKTVKEICQGLGMSRATFYRYVQTEKRKKVSNFHPSLN
jgi:DNA invertase Pin-like site-specific DNA recombinase